jgi:hypothetical protein
LALSSVRTQKRLSASLFDQRKLSIVGKQQPPKRLWKHQEETVEFTTIPQQESIPLVQTSSNPFASTGSLEVV